MQIVMTRGIAALMDSDEIAKFVYVSLTRHLRHDWGDVCPQDWRANDLDLETGGRVLSVYKGTETIWITQDDHITIMLPSEY